VSACKFFWVTCRAESSRSASDPFHDFSVRHIDLTRERGRTFASVPDQGGSHFEKRRALRPAPITDHRCFPDRLPTGCRLYDAVILEHIENGVAFHPSQDVKIIPMSLTHTDLKIVADAVDPMLAVIALLTPWIWRPTGGQRRLRFYLTALAALGIMYALRAFEHSSHAVGPSWDVHYSSHTGFTVVLATVLALWRWWFSIVGVVVLFAYGDLMIYQHYHSLADIAVTALLICPLTLVIYKAPWPPNSVKAPGHSKGSETSSTD
jgi:hypothetical protein